MTPQDERVLGLIAGIDTRRSFWMSEGPVSGLQLRLFAETSHGLHAAYSGDVYRADARLHFPLGRTVLSLRWNEAWANPTPSRSSSAAAFPTRRPCSRSSTSATLRCAAIPAASPR